MKEKNYFVSNIIMQINDLILFKLIMVATDYYDEEEEILESIDFDEDVEIYYEIFSELDEDMCEAESVI